MPNRRDHVGWWTYRADDPWVSTCDMLGSACPMMKAAAVFTGAEFTSARLCAVPVYLY